jgi:hypothetical protein
VAERRPGGRRGESGWLHVAVNERMRTAGPLSCGSVGFDGGVNWVLVGSMEGICKVDKSIGNIISRVNLMVQLFII